jgi:hypothetical protein
MSKVQSPFFGGNLSQPLLKGEESKEEMGNRGCPQNHSEKCSFVVLFSLNMSGVVEKDG